MTSKTVALIGTAACGLLLSVSSQAFATPYSDLVTADGASRYFRFEEAAGPAIDSGTAPNDGVYGASSNLAASSGIVGLGSAVGVDGTATGTVSGVALQTPGGAHPSTIEFWMSVAPQTGNNTAWRAPAVFGTETGGCCNDGRFGYIRADGSVAGSIGNDAGPNSGSDARGAGWHYYAFVRNAAGNNIDLYVDGGFVAGAASNTQTVTSNWDEIGRQIGGTQNSGRILADIDELAIYTTALSAGQIGAHFDAAFDPGIIVPEPSSIGLALFGMLSVGLVGRRRRRRTG